MSILKCLCIALASLAKEEGVDEKSCKKIKIKITIMDGCITKAITNQEVQLSHVSLDHLHMRP